MIFVKNFLGGEMTSKFLLPLSQTASSQLTQLRVLIDELPTDESIHDSWSYI